MTSINKNTLKGNWNQLIGEIQSKWGKLTDDDLQQVKGNKNAFLGLLEEKYGYGKEYAKEELNKFLERQGLDTDGESVIDQTLEDIYEYTDEAKEAIADYASQNLFKTIGIAALAGAAIALLIRR